MIRMLFCTLAVAVLASGCCGPMGCGPGCGIDNCYDCDGATQLNPYMGPMDTLRQMRQRVVCGSGCGEVYRGEWMSTPPDCVDPCCGDKFVGGAYPARPFCWQPGALLSLLCPTNIYGGRFCDGCGESFATCDCGGGEYIEQDAGGSCNCASCNSQNSHQGTRLATQRMPAKRDVSTHPATARAKSR